MLPSPRRGRSTVPLTRGAAIGCFPFAVSVLFFVVLFLPLTFATLDLTRSEEKEIQS
jgi:hypothetical protein